MSELTTEQRFDKYLDWVWDNFVRNQKEGSALEAVVNDAATLLHQGYKVIEMPNTVDTIEAATGTKFADFKPCPLARDAMT